MHTLLQRFRALALGALLVLVAHAAEPAKKNYDLSAGDAATRLKQFSETSGRETLFAAETVRGVRTAPIKGEFTPREALERMLDGTGLMVVQDEKTGALGVKKDPDPNAPRAAQTESDRPASQSKIEGGKLVLDKFEVTGRIDGLNNQGILPTTERQPIYHETITRAEIERMGVSSFEELFRYIPQTTSGENGFQAAVTNANVGGGTVANISRVGLRGFAQNQTLILINGRVQPRSATFTTSGPDLSRIPIAAIDRVEILPLSGTALYGGGAVGGAINIILRRDFSAKELTTYVGTSTDGGATEYRVSYLDGRSFELFGRKTNLTLLLDYRHREPLYQRDRNYLQRVLDKYGPNTAVRNAAGVSAFELFTIPAFAGSRATILVNSAPTAAVNDLGIPGASGLRWVQIPAGTTEAQSNALTPASFTAAAGQFTPGGRFADQTIYNPENNYSLNLEFEHALTPKLSLYAEVGYIYMRANYSFPQGGVSLNLTATDPLNPFRTGVTPGFVGRPIRVFFDPADIADPSVFEERETIRGVLGVKGKLFEKWEWSLDGSYDYNHTYTASNNTVSLLPSLLSLAGFGAGTDTVTGQPWVAAPPATRRAVYPVLADHGQFPVPASDTDKYWYSYRYSGSVTTNYIGIGRVTGPVYELPAGTLTTSVLGNYTVFDRVGGQNFANSDDVYMLLTGFPYRNTPSANPNYRGTLSGAMEAVVPVFNDKWRPRFIPLQSLDLNFSARREQAKSDFLSPSNGAYAANTKYGKSLVAAAKVQVIPDLAVRYSYSDGVYVPDWNDFGDPRRTFLNFQSAPDPKRGNISQPIGTYNVLNGGNPDLESELSTSRNLGLIFTPRFVKGLSLTVDYWTIVKKNGIALISAPTLVLQSDDFTHRITRDPLTPADAALGYTAGLITFIDQTRMNVARIETDGVDVQVNYDFDAGTLGRFHATANSTFTNKFSTQNVPGAVFINTAGVSGPRRWRGRAALTWSKERWETTISGRYSGHYSVITTAPTAATPTGFPLDGGRLPAFMRYDLQVSYAIPATADKGWRSWLSGTKWTLGCQNILNDEPAMVSDGTGFYDRQDDPRQRFVYVSIKKSL